MLYTRNLFCLKKFLWIAHFNRVAQIISKAAETKVSSHFPQFMVYVQLLFEEVLFKFCFLLFSILFCFLMSFFGHYIHIYIYILKSETQTPKLLVEAY